MPFFEKASKIIINSSTMNDIKGDLHHNDQRSKVTNKDSYNSTTTNTKGSYNDSSRTDYGIQSTSTTYADLRTLNGLHQGASRSSTRSSPAQNLRQSALLQHPRTVPPHKLDAVKPQLLQGRPDTTLEYNWGLPSAEDLVSRELHCVEKVGSKLRMGGAPTSRKEPIRATASRPGANNPFSSQSESSVRKSPPGAGHAPQKHKSFDEYIDSAWK